MRLLRRWSLPGLLLVLVLGLAGCAGARPEQGQPVVREQAGLPAGAPLQPGPAGAEEEKPAPVPPGPLPPNEAGQVMVLMYHQVGEPEAEWRRTPENLRRDLEILYEEGYRLVSLADYATGRVNLPAGYSPVVLTFDDGTQGQFNLLAEGDRLVEDPRSAVGILNDFFAAHPDFGRTASFFVFYPRPFGQADLVAEKFRRLREYGMEIGNHTAGHQDLSRLSDDEVQRVLVEQAARTAELLPGYQVRSLALPYGARPKDRALALTGKWQGISYRHDAVLLVGANPAPSPYSSSFDPAAIPRVRASDPYLGQWLEHFRRHPEKRYVSDGDPQKVTVPAAAAGEVAEERLAGRTLVIWQP